MIPGVPNHDHIEMPWRRCHDEWAKVDAPSVPESGYIDVWFPHSSSCCEAAYERRAAAAPPQRSLLRSFQRRHDAMSAADSLSRADDTIGTVMCLAKTL